MNSDDVGVTQKNEVLPPTALDIIQINVYPISPRQIQPIEPPSLVNVVEHAIAIPHKKPPDTLKHVSR